MLGDDYCDDGAGDGKHVHWFILTKNKSVKGVTAKFQRFILLAYITVVFDFRVRSM